MLLSVCLFVAMVTCWSLGSALLAALSCHLPALFSFFFFQLSLYFSPPPLLVSLCDDEALLDSPVNNACFWSLSPTRLSFFHVFSLSLAHTISSPPSSLCISCWSFLMSGCVPVFFHYCLPLCPLICACPLFLCSQFTLSQFRSDY